MDSARVCYSPLPMNIFEATNLRANSSLWSWGAVWPDCVYFESSWQQNFLQKKAKWLATFWPLSKNLTLRYVKTALATLGQLFDKIWATFYSNIWSHCRVRSHFRTLESSSSFSSSSRFCRILFQVVNLFSRTSVSPCWQSTGGRPTPPTPAGPRPIRYSKAMPKVCK